MDDQGSSNNCGSSSGSEKGSGTRITRSQRGGNSSSTEESTTASTSTVKPEPSVKVEESARPTTNMDDAVHPRKRKIKMKEPEVESPVVSLVDQPMSNCYETFLSIRKQVGVTIIHHFIYRKTFMLFSFIYINTKAHTYLIDLLAVVDMYICNT
nr:uncharacterized protein LOC128703410 [Cherax quadricarinatus]